MKPRVRSSRSSLRSARSLAFVAALGLAFAAALLLASPASFTLSAAHAETPAGIKKAGKHFQRGVTLYNEADYRAALVEFRRAYEVAPNPAVLYNIGQTYYQLQSYAQALTTFERYLAESGDAAAHKKDIEETVEILRARVGKLALSVNLDGCEVTVDDELAGKTPIGEPVLVSIGRRKVIVMCEGRAAETRVVEVAAGDVLEVKIALPMLSPAATNAAAASVAARPTSSSRTSAATWRKVGWTATGVFAAGALATGVLALVASNDLDEERKTYPSSLEDLDDKSKKVRRYSIAADVLGAAALITGGVTLTFTLTSRSPKAEKREQNALRLNVAPGSLAVSGTFD
jgi:tetratricopeptide (TPR) repeat protein